MTKTSHCRDCCCAESWDALGVTEYDAKSIPEHITELRAERDATLTLCGDCRHWRTGSAGAELGSCLVAGSFRAPGGLFTESDFGCIHGRKP